MRIDDAPTVVIPLPAHFVPPLRARAPRDGKVIVGIRPEHLRLSPAADAPAAGAVLGTVELAEVLGHEQLLHLRVHGVPLIVRGDPGERPDVGATVRVTVDGDTLHLFDAESGVTLRP